MRLWGRPPFIIGAWVNFYLVLLWIVLGTLWTGVFVWLFLAQLAITVAILVFTDWVWDRSKKKDKP